ncbi:hypothetical protein J3R80_14600 [Aliiroseovarius sp. Z3]|uniref:cupin domain-containing protein n=1 Tax=Aliiroseovarius sp. Z3 TaxID=2811402 RepID=UPI0023B227F2|nr:hypothetical protein [Aliiroseovarius sp. Z3]MDE9451701.1 hypothetical protein [Aliiroseovarius sp. Z3]
MAVFVVTQNKQTERELIVLPMNAPIIHRNRETPWTPLAPGIEMQILHADEKYGVWTVKIFMHAGSTLPPHRQ